MKYNLQAFDEKANIVFSIRDGVTSGTQPVRIHYGMLEVEIQCEEGKRDVIFLPQTLLVRWTECTP